MTDFSTYTKTQLQEIAKGCADTFFQNKQLKTDAETLESEYNNLNDLYEVQKKQIKDLTLQNNELQKNIQRIQATPSEHESEYQTMNKQLQTQLKKQQTIALQNEEAQQVIIRDLRKELEQKNPSDADQHSTVVEDLKLQIKQLQNTLDQKPTSEAAHINHCKKYEEQIINLTRERSELQNNNVELKTHVSDLEQRGQILLSQIPGENIGETLLSDTLQSELAVSNRTISEQKSDLETARSTIQTLQRQVAQLTTSLGSLEGGDQKQKDLIQTQSVNLLQLQKQVDELQKTIDSNRVAFTKAIETRNNQIHQLFEHYKHEAADVDKLKDEEIARCREYMSKVAASGSLLSRGISKGLGYFSKSGGRRPPTRKRLGRRGRQGMRTRKYRRR